MLSALVCISLYKETNRGCYGTSWIAHALVNILKRITYFNIICKINDLLSSVVILNFQELQCSDWSNRPLSEEQIQYAAADAFYLLEIFSIFQQNICNEGTCVFLFASLKKLNY